MTDTKAPNAELVARLRHDALAIRQDRYGNQLQADDMEAAAAALAQPAGEPVAWCKSVRTITDDYETVFHEGEDKPSGEGWKPLCDCSPAQPAGEPVAIARKFHDAFERLAPKFGYEHRKEILAFDPESQDGKLLIAMVREVCPPAQPAEPVDEDMVRVPEAAWQYAMTRLRGLHGLRLEGEPKPIDNQRFFDLLAAAAKEEA